MIKKIHLYESECFFFYIWCLVSMLRYSAVHFITKQNSYYINKVLKMSKLYPIIYYYKVKEIFLLKSM